MKIFPVILWFVCCSLHAEPQRLSMATNIESTSDWLGFYQTKARQGDAHAQFKIGYAYEIGEGLPQDDSKAFSWYEKAARQGHKNAILNLAAMDKAGQPYLDSEVEYQTELELRAAKGEISAKNHLARMLINNVLYEPNRQQIFQWIEQLAVEKHRDSQYILGQMYEMGISIPQNFILAYAWYSIAAAAGDDRAQFNRDALVERMSQQQLEQGQAHSRQLFEQMS